MFGRHNSVASSANRHPPPSSQASSSLKRSKTTASTRPSIHTKSDLLNPGEKKKQAVSAAQRALAVKADSRPKPIAAQRPAPVPSSFNTPPPRRQGLAQLDTNRDDDTRTNVRYSRCGAPPESVTSRDYSGESSYSPSPIPAGLGRFYAERYGSYGYNDDEDDDDVQGTIIRKRWSMPVQMDSGIRDGRLFTESTVVPEDDEYDPYASGFTPEPVSSTPSSFKRLGRSRSTAIFSSKEKSQASNDQTRAEKRKSTSFLRGGTDFMPESMKQNPQTQFKPRERRSYYTPSADRPVFAEETMSQYKRNDHGEWGALRCAVKKKARKISDLFGSMRGKLGIKSKTEDSGDFRIPEQHVAASRSHFGRETPPILQQERIRPLGPRELPPKIRSSFVVSRVPTLHHVHSDEVLQSFQGSIRVPTPIPEAEHLEDPYGTVSTCSSLAWKSTISSRDSTVRGPPVPLESIFERDLQTPCLPEENIKAPRHRKDRYNVDVRRLYSALVKNLDEKPPVLKPIPPKAQDTDISDSPSDQHDHHTFQTYRTALAPAPTLEDTGSNTIRRSSRVTFEEPPRRSPPPIPDRPVNYQRRKSTAQPSVDAYAHSDTSGAPFSEQEGPQHATPVKKARTKKCGVSFAASAPQSAICGEMLDTDKNFDRADNVRDHVELPEIHAASETKLPDWNHPSLGKIPTTGICSDVEAWKRRVQPGPPVLGHDRKPVHSPISDAALMIRNDHFGITRSKSVADNHYNSGYYNREHTKTPLQRTRTAFGFQKSGNALGREATMSGRNVRSSMVQEFDISAAVRMQFGPIAGDEGEYDEQDIEGWIDRSHF